jgi:succinate-semialdehyde dehydrogenase/glutarate-semialdehyde dehydrogenase
MVAAALGEGACAAQPEMTVSMGYFFPPMVLTTVPTDSILVREEIFGPVAPVVE